MTIKTDTQGRIRAALEAALKAFSTAPADNRTDASQVTARRVVLERTASPRKLRPEPLMPKPRRLAIGPYAPAPMANGNAVLSLRPYAGQTMNLFRDDFVG